LERDPATEARPDYSSPEMRVILEERLKEGETLEELIERFMTAWDSVHRERMEQWAEQNEEAELQQQEERRRAEEERRREVEERQRHEEGKTKMRKQKERPMITNKVVGSNFTPCPLSYALSKLRAQEYVELYYFSPEGCRDAYNSDKTMVDALAATCHKDQIILKPMAAHKPSSKVVKDIDLSWGRISMAKTVMLKHMEKEGWSEEQVVALSTFFYKLDGHKVCTRPGGKQALVCYAADIRLRWHDNMKAPGDEGIFNIGIINNDLLERIYNK
ncbi:hypothetical protein FA15DRAFT_556419, partial [Coprinopsis marcescibilis]